MYEKNNSKGLMKIEYWRGVLEHIVLLKLCMMCSNSFCKINHVKILVLFNCRY